ncbi:MAG: HAMP domain-containing protein [Flavobacteriales bacterium]|nr:HAMP domain-containing protein [Flavobacteriales bacterium]
MATPYAAVRKTILPSVAAIAVAMLALWSNGTGPSTSETVARIEHALQGLEHRTELVLRQVEKDSIGLAGLAEQWDREGIGLIIYDAGKATAWSTRMLPFPASFGPRDRPENGVVRLRNGHYVCRTAEHNGQMLVAYGLLRTDYGFENRHVRNGWNPTLGLDARHRLTLSETDTYPLHSISGEVVVHVRLSNATDPAEPLTIALWWLALLLLLFAIGRLADLVAERKGRTQALALTIGALVGLRGLMLALKAPADLYGSELFGPGQYAASWLHPSLGDLLLNVFCLLMVALRLRPVQIHVGRPWTVWVMLLIAQLTVHPVHWLLHSLVNDSAFPLDLNMPFALTWYSIIGLGISFLILSIWFLVLRWLIQPLGGHSAPWGTRLTAVAVTYGLTVLAGLHDPELLPVAVVGGALVSAMAIQTMLRPKMTITTMFTPLVAIFSLFGTVVLHTELHNHELEDREKLARKLDMQQDPISEYLFAELEETLLNDRELRNALALLPGSTDPAAVRLQRRLQYEHWNRYRTTFRMYLEDGQRLFGPDMSLDTVALRDMEAQYGDARPTLAAHLRFMANGSGHRGYLARIVFEGKRERPNMILFLELRSAGIEEIPGFTDLFIDEGVSLTRALEGYSFARYRNGDLNYQSGDFRYGLRADAFDHAKGDLERMALDGADHLVHRPDADTMVVVSRPVQGILGHLTIFSYLFLFYFGCAVILAASEAGLLRPMLKVRSFRQRINLAMAGMMTTSLLIIGLLTVYYVVNSHDGRNRSLITEKSLSVQVELEQRLGERTRLELADRQMLAPVLSGLSQIFFADINLYGLDGRLLSSSRPRVFKEGFMAQMMDPAAYTAMRFGHHSSLIRTERIGRLEYQTAYLPFRNTKGDIIAFLSIPYFGRQYGLQQEILSLLAPLIDIYVFLILLGVMVALFISNRITEPLRIIRQSLRDLRLEGGNRAIRWDSRDEIGELVQEYNRTLEELVRSAERLARSERESAWREMAKQVAHEIKNPLTPMKLGIQMLERSYRDGAPDLGERIERMGRTLIEQIDTLSHIASEFSSFAQMPHSVMEDFDLRELLLNVAELNRGQGAEILTDLPANGPCTVRADREQMLRVFNNLVRNALQAIPEDRQGRITLALAHNDGHWMATVHDNGTGIPEELREKVFVPNFTTKGGGMGLGLALCRRMVESADGSIRFETGPDAGTTFFVHLPAL